MVSSADIGLLQRVADLARRHGLRPSEAEASFGWVKENPNDDWGYYRLRFDSTPVDEQKADRLAAMKKSLGCDGCELRADEMYEIEDSVERAISLAPRTRSIG